MNTNKFHTFLSLVFCFIACSEEIETIENEEINSSINFSVGISDGISTRVTTGNDFKATFEDNDIIGLFIYKRNEGEGPDVDENELYVNNIKLTYSNGTWVLEEPIYYPGSRTLIDIYAYYPYKEGSDVHALEYNAHEEMTELLMASVIGMKKSENAIRLKFNHLQSLVHITLTKDDNVPDFDKNMNVYFNGIIGGRYNIATQVLADPVTGIIKMDIAGEAGPAERGYMAFIPEQEAAPGILFSIFQMTSNKEILSSKDIDQPEIFTRGQARLFRIRIKQEISKDITYNQYDLYPRYGIPVGMVVETYHGGKHGKVISLRNIVDVEWAILSAESYATGATDLYDGLSNKMKIQKLENWETDYPAYKACTTYGERWYLPSIGEMGWFFTSSSGNGYLLDRINSELRYHRNNNTHEGLIIEEVTSWYSYLSSTESSDNPAHAIKLFTGKGDWVSEPKHWRYNVRPFYEF